MLKNNNRSISLRGKILMAFAAFILVVLASLWLSQTVFLDDIYRMIKMGDMKKCSGSVIEAAESGDADIFDNAAGEMSRKYETCISAYAINDNNGERTGSLVMEKHVNSFCFIHNMQSEDILNKLYRMAEENGSEYTEIISLGDMFGVDENADSGKNVIYAKIIEYGTGNILLVFNSEIVPLKSTVRTLEFQLAVISVFFLIVAAVVSIVLAQRISKPIQEMSSEAGKLALGDYNVNFDGTGCSETENLSAVLNRAAYELSKLDKMQKDLIANVSHDLRTPLTMIAGYTEAMRDLPGEATPENMQIVIDETNRLTNLVNDMLEVSRYQGGTQKLKLARFNFTQVIRTTLERYGKLRERDGYIIRFEADNDVYLNADEGRMLQVIYNLINNAVNYTGDDKTVIIRQTVESAGTVLVEVIDTGIGISEEDLPLVWERYYKVNDFHKRANMGTGLGLSIVKNILLLHGAQFGVNSIVGKGSDFWFRLKIDGGTNETAEADETDETQSG